MDNDDLLQSLVDDLADDSEMDDEPKQATAPRLSVELQQGETVDEAKGRVALTPEYHAADSIWVLNQITAFKEADLTTLANRLEHETTQLINGNLEKAESMLASQAHTLDALFHHLLRRFALNVGVYTTVAEKYMKLALKAQSQCRTTLDSLVSMKRHPAELIRQTNIAHGHQQVNNFAEKEKAPNELLERTDGERLDFGKTGTAINIDQAVETVGEINRTTDA